ncbi:MAG: energy transducer TonB [Proteobacteria bacterium]|nr:energy transducer TonB [Desulfobulbaceae bacterium]MBU4151920.1 energy transducer TonB [Pseudomonadota bacterium]
MTRIINGLGLSLMLHGLMLTSLMSVANLPVPLPPRAIDFFILASSPSELPPIIAEEPLPAAPSEPDVITAPPPLEVPVPPVEKQITAVALSPPKKPVPTAIQKVVEPELQPVAKIQSAQGVADISSESSSQVADTSPSPPMGTVQTSASTGTGKPSDGTLGNASSVSAGHIDIRQQYLTMVRGRIESHKNYPIMARRRQIEGRVGIRFVISQEGEVRNVEIAQSSGYETLDQAAQKAVLAASPFAKPPAPTFNEEIPLELTIVFSLT